MNNNSVTGRDGYILKQALLYAIAAIESLPREEREQSNKEDMKTILEAMFGETYEKEMADTLWSSILRRFPKWDDDGADKGERPLVIPTGEPRWISEEEDAASPPSPRLRDEPDRRAEEKANQWTPEMEEKMAVVTSAAAENINRNHRA